MFTTDAISLYIVVYQRAGNRASLASPSPVYVPMLVPANVAPIRVRVQPQMEVGVPMVAALPMEMSVVERDVSTREL